MSETTTSTEAPSATSGAVIINLKNQPKKGIRKLRKGRGQLMKKVQRTIGKLQDNNQLTNAAQPVIVIVRPKTKKRR